MDDFEGFDEYPDLTRFLRYVTDERRLFNAALFGTVPEEWQKMLQKVGVYARRAAQEVAINLGAYDDVIKPMWDESNRILHGTRRMSGDAYLDLLQLGGKEVDRDVYRDPPDLNRDRAGD